MRADNLLAVVDWDVSQEELKEQVRKIIATARRENKVLTLPIGLSLDAMLALLSQVRCDSCEAVCCKISPPEEVISLTPGEYRALSGKYGQKGMRQTVFGGELELPCRFLKNNRCAIYPERPLVCMTFPFQPGGAIGGNVNEALDAIALASYCPEARRIAKAVYMTLWGVKQKIWSIGLKDAESLLRALNTTTPERR